MYYYLTGFLLVKKNYKYFIGYLHNDHKVMPLKCNASYTKHLYKKLMDKLNGYIFIKDDDILGKFNTI